MRRKNHHKIFIFILFFLASCATTGPGIYHTVEKGQTLWRISRTYGVDIQTIAEYNDIYDPDLIYAGQELFIPGASKILKVEIYKGEEEKGEIVVNKGLLAWPTEGVVYSLFGIRWGRMHKGIDISGKLGTPIIASKDGRVIFTGTRGGYGKTVMLEHEDDFVTLYAHLNGIKVANGDVVKQGDVIGYMGSTGKSTGPHLHFEIQKDGKARNPLFFLP